MSYEARNPFLIGLLVGRYPIQVLDKVARFDSCFERRCSMTASMKKRVVTPLIGLLLLALAAAGCGTVTGAAVGAATGAAIGAGTGYGAGKGALIGTGVGAAAGAIYDITKHE
jgi:hypothetical protein